MSSIFDLSAELMRIQMMMDETDGEIPPAVIDWLESAESDFNVKVEGWASVISELEARSKARKDESRRIAELAASDDRRADSMRRILKDVMTQTGQTRVETLKYKIWIQGAGGKPSLQFIEGEVPEEFKTTELVEHINKDLIRERLEAGEQLSFAHLIPKGTILRIK